MPARRRSFAPRIRDCVASAVTRKVRRCMATVAYHFTRGTKMRLLPSRLRGGLVILAAWAVVSASAQQNLPGTKVLLPEADRGGDPAAQMVEGIHSFLDRETVLAGERRQKLAAAPDREHFRRIIGAVDRR